MFGRNRRRRVVRRQGKLRAATSTSASATLIRQILGELRALLALDADDPRVRRLYPSAYADDAEKEDEYRRLTHEELQSGRLANVDAVEESIDAELLTRSS